MQANDYVAARSVDEAIATLQRGGGQNRLLAGGSDVIVQVREGRRAVDTFVDVKTIPEASVLSYDPKEGLRVGAATSCVRIYEDDTVRRLYPALVDSASLIGSVQIQSRATLGGNLCNSSPAADTIPTLLVLGATAHIAGPKGWRTVPVAEFCTAPGRNVLAPDELLVALVFPPPTPRSGAFFLRFIPRNEMDIAVVNAAAWIVLDQAMQTITDARIAVGAVAPTPLLVKAAADAIIGQPATEETFARAAEAAVAAARPISDMRGTAGQRKHLTGVLTRRALAGALTRAREANA